MLPCTRTSAPCSRVIEDIDSSTLSRHIYRIKTRVEVGHLELEGSAFRRIPVDLPRHRVGDEDKAPVVHREPERLAQIAGAEDVCRGAQP